MAHHRSMLGVSAAALAAAALLTAAMPASAAKAQACVPTGSKTLASSDLVRVYSVTAPSNNGFAGKDVTYVVCRYATGKATVVGRSTSTPRGNQAGAILQQVRIAGRWVALGFVAGGGYGGTFDAWVRRVDVSSGKATVVDLCRSTDCQDRGPGASTDSVSNAVRSLELLRDGRMAWISEFSHTQQATVVAHTLRVGRLDSRGAAVLDDSPGIDPRSLAMNTRLVYWTRDAQARSSALV